jgi:hypothetical protein
MLLGKTYELRPEISVPEYRTDAARAIDAYEMLMHRFMDMTEINFARTERDIETVIGKLNSIEDRLRKLSGRIARIEKALRIEEAESSMTSRTESAREQRKAEEFLSSTDKQGLQQADETMERNR